MNKFSKLEMYNGPDVASKFEEHLENETNAYVWWHRNDEANVLWWNQ